MNKGVIIIAAILIVAVAGFMLFNNSSLTGNVVNSNTESQDSGNIEEHADESSQVEVDDTEDNSQDLGTPDKIFVLTGENFKFLMDGSETPELRVKQGDIVRIEFTSTSGFHDWKVDEFNAATKQVNTGSSTFVEFVADNKGTFEYYCGVGQHRANGMKGNLIVE